VDNFPFLKRIYTTWPWSDSDHIIIEDLRIVFDRDDLEVYIKRREEN
jgi:hypothetical protein